MSNRITLKPVVRSGSSWKLRLMGMILLVAAVLFSLSFFISYQIFIKKLEETNLKATILAFGQTERNIDRKLQLAANNANRLLYRDEVQDYIMSASHALPDKSLTTMKAADELSSALAANQDLSGIALVDGVGRAIGVTVWGMTAMAALPQDGPPYTFLQESESRYPFYTWFGVSEVSHIFSGIPEFKYFFESRGAVPVRMLVGIRTISFDPAGEGNAYLMVSLGDSGLRECYSQVLYNQDTAVLLDAQHRVISTTGSRDMNEKPNYADLLPSDGSVGSFRFQEESGEGYQIIYYPLPRYGWTLVNEIPKKAYGQQADELKCLLLFLWFSTLSLMLLFFTIWIGKYTRPVERIIHSMKLVQDGDLSPIQYPPSGIRELDELGVQFAATVSTVSALLSRVRSMDKEMAAEELRTLQYQINPHFLYNSLSSIRWLAMMNNNPKVADSLLLLARIIEPILRAPSFYWTVGEELGFVDSYVGMLTLRFGGSLTCEIDCGPELDSCVFPRFTLQPILENCFVHGIIPGDIMRIRVSLTRSDGMLRASVANTGTPIEPSVLEELNSSLALHREPDGPSGNIGLLNVNKRLFLLYGARAKMHISSDKGTGTTVMLEIPDDVPENV